MWTKGQPPKEDKGLFVIYAQHKRPALVTYNGKEDCFVFFAIGKLVVDMSTYTHFIKLTPPVESGE